MNKNKDIRTLKGIGDKTASLYHKVGIYTYGDLMYYFPKDYVHYGEAETARDELTGSFCFINVLIKKRPLLRRAGKMSVVSCEALSEDKPLRAVWFHLPYITNTLKAGIRYVFGGTLKKAGSSFSMEQPLVFSPSDFEKLKNTLQPVYALTKGLSNNAIRKAVLKVLELDNGGSLIGDMPENDVLNTIHFPKDIEKLKEAREAVIFDEFLMFMIRLKLLREENSKVYNDYEIKSSDAVHKLMESLPYALTNAQIKVFNEVEHDLTEHTSMSRLIQGDVGCGKTIVAVMACLTVALSGYQSVLMVPTEILAVQHYDTFTKLITKNGMNVSVCLLTGSMSAAEKRKTYQKIADGKADIVIGTHALFQEKVEYKSLALVVTDEQHRFGVRQRGMLVEKGNSTVPHVLVMSATPIPRTLAIMLYGDLDISVIDEVPAKRLPIKNCVVNTGYRKKAYEFIEKEVRSGHQAYVICPLVEESEGLDCKDVVSYSDELKSFLSKDINVACMHGRMKASKKDEVMRSFLEHETDVLVSTTVVEVGVNVPNATVMMIENSERFGLAQLHQLRGRIGRGDAQSYCIFINCSDSERSRKRLDILNHSNDGFYIASEDLKLRGPGDMFGIRQSGEMEFKLGDIYNDAAILTKAAKKAGEILDSDPRLEHEENTYIRERLKELSERSDMHAL